MPFETTEQVGGPHAGCAERALVTMGVVAHPVEDL